MNFGLFQRPIWHTTLQIYTNMVVANMQYKHSKLWLLLLLLSFDVVVPQVHIPLLFLDKGIVEIYLDVGLINI